MTKPFAGVRVLDLTNVIAGPLASYQLALLGAEVIKIEVPGVGDLARKMGADPALGKRQMGASYLAMNAGKKSITLNLKSARGKEIFGRLVETADVVLENFRPGAMARLGLARGDAAGAQQAADLLRDLRLRPDRTVGGTGKLRPDHPGLCRADGADRRCNDRTDARRPGGVRHHGGDHRRLRHRRGAVPPRVDRRGRGDRRVDAGCLAGVDDLVDDLQPSERRAYTEAARQPQPYFRAVGHVPHPGRRDQPGQQRAEAVRRDLRRARAGGAGGRSAVCRARRPDAQPGRAARRCWKRGWPRRPAPNGRRG